MCTQQSFTDSAIVLDRYDQSVISYYETNKINRYLKTKPKFNEGLIKSSFAQVLFNLSLGDYYLYGPSRKDDKASEYYLSALSLSEKLKSNDLIAECLLKIIEYQHYTSNKVENTLALIDRREYLIFDDYSILENNFLRLKSEYLNQIDKLIVKEHDTTDWERMIFDLDQLIIKSKDQNYFRIVSNCQTQKAYLLGDLGRSSEAILMYEASLVSAEKVSKLEYHQKYFTIKANVLLHYFLLEQYEKVIELHFNIEHSQIQKQGPDELLMYYGWISQAYKELGQLDSALYYQELRFELDSKTNAAKEARNVAEVKSKFEKEKHEFELSIWRRRLIIAASLVLLLAGATYGNHRYQSLKKKAVESELQKTKIQATLDVTKAKMQGEQEERKVIASVLHDQVASLLTAADMHLTAAKKQGNPSESNSIQKADEIIKDVNEQVRNLSHQLVSPTLLKFGLVPALDSLVDKMQNDKIRFSFSNNSDGSRIDSSKEIFLYRSCSELMQNALKYSNGDRASITLDQDDKMISITVYDDGNMVEQGETNNGLGLAHIKNNVEALAGKFTIDKSNGFKVEMSVPVS